MATTFRPTPRYALRAPMPSVRREADLAAVWAAVLGYLMLSPPQLNFEILGVVFPPYRFFLIPSVLFIFRSFANGTIRFAWPDALLFAATVWAGFALYFSTDDTAGAFASLGAVATDTFVAYLFARATFISTRQVRIFLILMAPGLVVIGLIMMAESVTGQRIIQPFFAAITGQPMPLKDDFRYGLLRARGPFPHPILGGIFMVSFYPVYLMSGVRGWPKIAGIVAGVVSVFTLSSAALLGLSLSSALMCYNWLVERYTAFTWRLFFLFATILYVLADFGTQSGAFNLLVRYASLQTTSAYNRVLIWRFGTENVAANPWFGIGYNDWVRPRWMKGSIDHYWLLQAIQFGIIPPILLALTVIIAIWKLSAKSVTSPLTDQRVERGFAIALAVFSLGIVSVSIWLQAQVWYYMLIGIVVSLAAATPERRPLPRFAVHPPAATRGGL